jgi:O-antigen/teichoic acid export membrane protein
VTSVGTEGTRTAGRTGRHGWVRRFLAHVKTPLYGNAYALILSNASISGLGLVFWILSARLYTAEAVGIGSGLLSAMFFISGVAQLNLRSALNRFVPVAGRQTGRLVATAYAVTIPISFLLALAVGTAVSITGIGGAPMAAIGSDVVMILLFAVGTAAWSIYNMQDGVLTGLRRASIVPIENTSYALAKLAFVIVFAGTLPTEGVFLSWSVPVIGAAALVTILLFGRLIPQHERRTGPTTSALDTHRIVRFVAGDFTGALLVMLYISLLPVLVIAQVGPTAGAHFYIVWIIATSLNLIPLSLAISHTVEAAMAEDQLIIRSREVLVLMVRLLLPVTAIVVTAAGPILTIFGPGYAEAGAPLLQLLALGVLPYGITVLYFSFARVTTRVRGIVVTQAYLAIVILVATQLLLPSMGIAAVGVGWLLGQGSAAMLLLLGGLRPVIGHPPPSVVGPS